MQDLLKIIKWKDEISQIEYMLTKLEVAEEKYAEEERYEQAQLMLLEQKRLLKRKRYLQTKIKNT